MCWKMFPVSFHSCELSWFFVRSQKAVAEFRRYWNGAQELLAHAAAASSVVAIGGGGGGEGGGRAEKAGRMEARNLDGGAAELPPRPGRGSDGAENGDGEDGGNRICGQVSISNSRFAFLSQASVKCFVQHQRIRTESINNAFQRARSQTIASKLADAAECCSNGHRQRNARAAVAACRGCPRVLSVRLCCVLPRRPTDESGAAEAGAVSPAPTTRRRSRPRLW